jgi:hypothetical protein
MQQQNIPIGTLVDMYKRGELRLPEIRCHYVLQACLPGAWGVKERAA